MSQLKCPTCGKAREGFEAPAAHLPFCSARCKQADMGKWFGGFYTVSRPLEASDEIDLFQLDEEEHGTAEREFPN